MKMLPNSNTSALNKPVESQYSPGYYAVYFEDPGGMKLELAFTPFQIPTLQKEQNRIKAKERCKRSAASKANKASSHR